MLKVIIPNYSFLIFYIHHFPITDIVTQIPLNAQGFKHIGISIFYLFHFNSCLIISSILGTMVLLDRNGNLMVDPSVIEKSWSHRQGLNFQIFHFYKTFDTKAFDQIQ
jgi:hypothetical protein